MQPEPKKITLLQTCDPQVYPEMLRCSRAINEYYAAKAGLDYSCYIGLKRGFYPWQAVFNRVFLIKEMLDSGFTGWVFYLDADAYVADLGFDLQAYLREHAARAFIAGPGARAEDGWDVNSGAFLINLGHPNGRRLAELWHADVMSTPEAHLAAAPNWHDVTSDQRRLHGILAANPGILADIRVEDRTFMGDVMSGFARQILRVYAPTLEERVAAMRTDIAAILAPLADAPLPEAARPAVLAPSAPGSMAESYALVGALYEVVLGRPADVGGLEYDAERLRSKGRAAGLQLVFQELLGSDEYRARQGA